MGMTWNVGICRNSPGFVLKSEADTIIVATGIPIEAPLVS